MEGTGVQGEVIVVDNASTDDTAQIALAFGARVVTESRRQISSVRNAGAAACTGEYIIFVDADTLISPDLLGAVLDEFDAGVCGGGSLIRFELEATGFAAWTSRFWHRVSKQFKLPAGCFLYSRRDAFFAVGGFSQEVYATEEIWFSRKLKAWGKKNSRRFVMLEEHPPITSSRKLGWFPTHKLLIYTLLFTLFPFAVRFRALCSFWYERPEKILDHKLPK